VDGPRSWSVASFVNASIVACVCAPVMFAVFVQGRRLTVRFAGNQSAGRGGTDRRRGPQPDVTRALGSIRQRFVKCRAELQGQWEGSGRPAQRPERLGWPPRRTDSHWVRSPLCRWCWLTLWQAAV
jgi:hypothetical protein